MAFGAGLIMPTPLGGVAFGAGLIMRTPLGGVAFGAGLIMPTCKRGVEVNAETNPRSAYSGVCTGTLFTWRTEPCN